MTTLGVIRETGPGERRVAVVPDTVPKLRAAGLDVLVEADAGTGAGFGDESYVAAGASIVAADELSARADIVVCVTPPAPDRLRAGQFLIGLLEPAARPAAVRAWAERGVTALSLDRLPRTVSRAQAMDALTSQAAVAGYKAVLVAADAYAGYFPMMTTAAGTMRPASVLVLGCGVAGLAAIGTARRLGAVVTASDVRPAARDDAASLGARWLSVGADAAGGGGYARALTDAEQEAQQAELDAALAGFDVVITTARVPGRRPPLLVTARAVAAMRPGSVLVDLAAGPLGGNVAGSMPDQTTVTPGGVTIVGAGDLAARVPTAASTAYSRNVAAVLAALIHDGAPVVDPDDDVLGALLVSQPAQELGGVA